MSVDKHEDKDNKKEELKEELRDRHEDEDRHYDVNKIHKKKDELKDNIVDNFNFWINVAFITLGVLLLLTVILLFYSIFSGSSNSSNNKTPITTSTTNESSIPIPKNTSWFSTPKPVVNTPLPPVIEKVSDTTSWFSTPKVVITDTKIPKTVNIIESPISDKLPESSSWFITPKTANVNSIEPQTSSQTITNPNVKIINAETNKNSWFSTLFSPSKKQEVAKDITTDVDVLNKNTSIGFTKTTLSKIPDTTKPNENKNSIFASFISPLYDRKVELPQMKHTGGSYNKILKRF